ncbi:MAG: hypothetical protein WD075_09485 [Rhodospirillales bacterium]
MRFSVLVFSALTVSAMISSPPLRADEIEINAVSFFDIPSNETVSVEIFDDAEEILELKKIFEDELRDKGYTIADKSRLILSFEARDTSGKWSGGGPNRLIDLSNTENHTGKDAPAVRLNIFDSERGGILNPKRDKGITQVAPSEFRIDAVIEDRQNGKRLWQGWTIIAESVETDGPALHRAMIKPLVDNIGKTVRNDKPSAQ